MKTYSELIKLESYYDRLDYLALNGNVGKQTFGEERYLNQTLYKSKQWRDLRNRIIVRDNGCDLGVPGIPIEGRIIIHHMNPISIEDIIDCSDYVWLSEYLICVSEDTHNKIHYGHKTKNSFELIERKPNDTCPWKKEVPYGSI